LRRGDNKPTAAYCAPGSPQAAFAVKSVIDEIGEKLDIDPFELRLGNASRKGNGWVEGPVFQRIGLVEYLEAARNRELYQTPLDGKSRGRMPRITHASGDLVVPFKMSRTIKGIPRASTAILLARLPQTHGPCQANAASQAARRGADQLRRPKPSGRYQRWDTQFSWHYGVNY